MSTLQKRLDSFKPYLIGIRYLDTMVVVDVLFKDTWTIPEDQYVKSIKGKDEINYYMICSEVDGIGLDDLLDYIAKVIRVNLEREEKHDLLRKKISELTDIFKKNTLEKLNNIRFTFDEITTKHLTSTPPLTEDSVETQIKDTTPPLPPPTQINAYLDENGNPIEMSEEEIEIALEEERGLRKIQQRPKNNVINNVELPPRLKPSVMETNMETNIETGCACGPDEACDKCIDTKY